MAKSYTKGRKLAPVPKREAPSSPPVETEPAQIAQNQEPEPPPAEPERRPAGRPSRAEQAEQKTPKTLTFFQRLARIAPEDWGTRANVKVYRLAPLINRLLGSEHRYITQYDEVVTLQKIKVDHGSGRYRLYLSYKGPAGSEERELDRIEIDILDPTFPPRIPPGEWMDDPRNKQWAWARPPGASTSPYGGYSATPPPPAPTPLAEVAEVFRVANDMRKEARAEIAANAPPPPPPPQAPPATDPWAAAEKILTMRSENPMVAILQTQIAAMQAEISESRKEQMRLQSENFAVQLAAIKAQIPNEKPKSLIEQATELATAADKLKSLLGGNGTEAAAAPRSRMSGTMEFFSDLLPKVFNSPIVNAIATRLAAAPAPVHANGAAPMNGQQPRPGQAAPQQSEQDEMFQWVNVAITPALVDYIENDMNGADFAEWVFNGFPDRLTKLQTITHASLPGQQGAPVIIALYRMSGQLWSTVLAPREKQFTEFVEQFCKWKPDGEDAPIDVKPEAEEEMQDAKGDF